MLYDFLPRVLLDVLLDAQHRAAQTIRSLRQGAVPDPEDLPPSDNVSVCARRPPLPSNSVL